MIKNKKYNLINKHGAKTCLIFCGIKEKNNVIYYHFKGLNGAGVRLTEKDIKNLNIEEI